MKKFLFVFLILCSLLCFVVACQKQHQHDYGSWVSNGDGTHTRVCKDDATHVETQNCSGGSATCTQQATCSHCFATYGALANHTEAIDPKVDATCTTTGLTEGKHCSVCDEILLAQTKTPQTHLYKNSFCTLCGKCCFDLELNADRTAYTLVGIGDCTDSDIVIPTTYNNKPITTIGNNAFKNCEFLTSVVIGNKISNIGWYAFYNCNSLTSVTIPNSVTNIGIYAFCDCKSLTSLDIPNSVTKIGEYAFANCKQLTEIVVPNSVKSIGRSAFYKCSGVTSITLPFVGGEKYGVTNMYFGYVFGAIKFEENSSCVPASLKNVNITWADSIEAGAFYECKDLVNITIPISVQSVGSEAFFGCTSLAGVYTTDIVAWCNIIFEDATANPLYYAKNLYLNEQLITDLVLPNNVMNISDYVFYNCESMRSVVIPNNVATIGEYAFYNCTNLTYNLKEDLNYLGNTVNPYLYLASTNNKDIITANIDGNCKFIASNAFYGCKTLTTVNIPDNLVSIGEGAFYTCELLTSITIPNGVKKIGKNVFFKCYSLKNVVIPPSITFVDFYAFEFCYNVVVLYGGTANDWAKIEVNKGNGYFVNATIYYYSESEPTDDGNYWHYDTDGKTPIIWQKQD